MRVSGRMRLRRDERWRQEGMPASPLPLLGTLS